jgi:hypothetical protein
MEIPTLGWTTAVADWHTDCQAWGIATDLTDGVALYYWDLSTTRNMSGVGRVLTIPALDFFFMNPGEA